MFQSALHGGLSRAFVAPGTATSPAITCSPGISAHPGFPLPSEGCCPSWYGLVDPFCSFQKARAGVNGRCLMLGIICETVGEGKRHNTIKKEEVLIRENYQQEEAPGRPFSLAEMQRSRHCWLHPGAALRGKVISSLGLYPPTG